MNVLGEKKGKINFINSIEGERANFATLFSERPVLHYHLENENHRFGTVV